VNIQTKYELSQALIGELNIKN